MERIDRSSIIIIVQASSIFFIGPRLMLFALVDRFYEAPPFLCPTIVSTIASSIKDK